METKIKPYVSLFDSKKTNFREDYNDLRSELKLLFLDALNTAGEAAQIHNNVNYEKEGAYIGKILNEAIANSFKTAIKEFNLDSKGRAIEFWLGLNNAISKGRRGI